MGGAGVLTPGRPVSPPGGSVDISRALVFLVSDDARYITGVPLPVDAGALVK